MPDFDPGRRARWVLGCITAITVAVSLAILIPSQRSAEAPAAWQWACLIGLILVTSVQYALWERYTHRNLRLFWWRSLARVGWAFAWFPAFVLVGRAVPGLWSWLLVGLPVVVATTAASLYAGRRLPDPEQDAA